MTSSISNKNYFTPNKIPQLEDITNGLITFDIGPDLSHPKYGSKTYPGIGYRLSFSHFDQKVLRVSPSYFDYQYHWHHVPLSLSDEEIDNSAIHFFQTKNGVPIFLINGQQTRLDSAFNDGCWITVEDFKKFRDSILAQTAPVKETMANPKNRSQKVIQNDKIQGRKLTDKDIGYQFVRLSPIFDPHEAVYYWDYVPEEGKKERIFKYYTPTLKSITNEEIKFSDGCSYPIVHNDDQWVLLTCFLRYRRSMAAPNPPTKEIPVYPLLMSSDIGKFFVRNGPHYSKSRHIYQWDNIPNNNIDTIRKEARQLIKIEHSRYYFSNPYRSTTVVDKSASWNDGHWMPAEEYCKQLGLKLFNNDPAHVALKQYPDISGESSLEQIAGKYAVRLRPGLEGFTYIWDHIPQTTTVPGICKYAILANSENIKDPQNWKELEAFIRELRIPFPEEPVDGHHPQKETQKVYPGKGKAIDSDESKFMVRVYPYFKRKFLCGKLVDMGYNWNHIPEDQTLESIKKAARYCHYSNYNRGNKPWKDEHWMDVNDYIDLVHIQRYKSPIEGHHPHHTTRMTYPALGRKLTADDIGKHVVRVFPAKDNYQYIWRFIPKELTFDAVEKSCGIYQEDIWNTFTIDRGTRKWNLSIYRFFNDSYWMPAKEFMKAMDIKPPLGSLLNHFLSRKTKEWLAEIEKCVAEYPLNMDHIATLPEKTKSTKKIDKQTGIPDLKSDDLFKILGITEDFEQIEVEKAFRRLSLIYHPDKKPEQAETFKKISKAYNAFKAIFRSVPFVSDPDKIFDAEYQSMMARFKYLEYSNGLSTIQLRDEWKALYKEAKKSYEKYTGDSKSNETKLLRDIRSYYRYYKLVQRIEELTSSVKGLSLSDAKDQLKQNLNILTLLQKQWARINPRLSPTLHYSNVGFHFLLDRYVGYSRQLIEIYISEENFEDAYKQTFEVLHENAQKNILKRVKFENPSCEPIKKGDKLYPLQNMLVTNIMTNLNALGLDKCFTSRP